MQINDRQKLIINFAKKQKIFRHKDIIFLLKKNISRITITRDLSFLVSQNILQKNQNRAQTTYMLSSNYKICNYSG